MRRTTAIRLLAVALVAGAVIAFTTSQPSKPNFSVRVIRFTFGDTNAVLEITNNAACHVDCWINVQDLNNLVARQPAKHTLTPHSVNECPISVPANLKMPADVSVAGHQPIKYWALRRRLASQGRQHRIFREAFRRLKPVSRLQTSSTARDGASLLPPSLSSPEMRVHVLQAEPHAAADFDVRQTTLCHPGAESSLTDAEVFRHLLSIRPPRQRVHRRREDLVAGFRPDNRKRPLSLFDEDLENFGECRGHLAGSTCDFR